MNKKLIGLFSLIAAVAIASPWIGDTAPQIGDNQQQSLNRIALSNSNLAASAPASGTTAATNTGAAHLASTHTTLNSSTATLIVVARPTRRTVVIRNSDTSLSMYVGELGVTSSTGMLVKASESIPYTFVGALYAISASGAPVSYAADEYD